MTRCAACCNHKVFITDWTDARIVPAEVGPFHLNDYVAYVQEFIRYIGPEVHVISVCQPTVPCWRRFRCWPAGEFTPRSTTMMGGPIDARKSPTAVNNLAMNRAYEWFENNVIYRVPPNFPGRAGASTRLPAAQRLRGDEPRPPPQLALRLLPGPRARRWRQRRFAPPVLRRIQRRAGHAGRVLPETIKVVFQDFARSSTAPGT